MSALRFVVVTMLLCGGLYPGVLLGVALLAPDAANGRLIVRDGQVVGSALVGQKFSRSEYLWPRPSAVDHNAAAAGGSNLGPTNPALTERAKASIAALGGDGPVPADLVTASGGGLDPHVTLAGALYQVPRIARARGVDGARIAAVFEAAAEPEGVFRPALVNVLQANLALDEALGRTPR